MKLSKDSLVVQAALITMTRMVLNMNTRIVYPFLPVIARGLGVSLAQMSLVLTVRSLTGVLSPFVTSLADRRGRRFGMLFGLAVFTTAIGLLASFPSYATFFVAQSLAYLGMFVTVSSMQAFLGDRVPYEQRGRLIGLTELGWAFSFILGMPLIGWLIDRGGWLAPYPLLAGLGFITLLVIYWLIPGQPPAQQPETGSTWANLRQVLTYGPALAGLAMSTAGTASNEVINLVFGDWLESSFGLSVLALGGASVVIGLSEMGGEGLVATLVDRIGKERSIQLGFILNGLVILSLPWLGQTRVGALAGLFLMYMTFEFAIVSSLTLITEIMPAARATFLGANVAAYSAGRGLGALLAPLAYSYGFRTNTLVAVALIGVVLFAISRAKVAAPQPPVTHSSEG